MEQVGQVVSVVVLDTVDISEVVDTSGQVVHSEEVIPAMDEL